LKHQSWVTPISSSQKFVVVLEPVPQMAAAEATSESTESLSSTPHLQLSLQFLVFPVVALLYVPPH